MMPEALSRGRLSPDGNWPHARLRRPTVAWMRFSAPAAGLGAILALALFTTAAEAAPVDRGCFHPFQGWVSLEGTLETATTRASSAARTSALARSRAAERSVRTATANLKRLRAALSRTPPSQAARRKALGVQVSKATRKLAAARSVEGARTREAALIGSGRRAYTLRVSGGRTGTGSLRGTVYRFDTPCHYRNTNGRAISASPLRITVVVNADTAIASATRVGPRAGDRVSLTLSGVRSLRHGALNSGRARALTVLGG